MKPPDLSEHDLDAIAPWRWNGVADALDQPSARAEGLFNQIGPVVERDVNQDPCQHDRDEAEALDLSVMLKSQQSFSIIGHATVLHDPHSPDRPRPLTVFVCSHTPASASALRRVGI